MKVFITFGQDHTHIINDIFLNEYSVATSEAVDLEQGHDKAIKMFHRRFHRCLDKAPDMSYFPNGIVDIDLRVLAHEQSDTLYITNGIDFKPFFLTTSRREAVSDCFEYFSLLQSDIISSVPPLDEMEDVSYLYQDAIQEAVYRA